MFGTVFRYGSTIYNIAVENPKGVSRGVASVTVDGAVADGGRVELLGDGVKHFVRVVMGKKKEDNE